MSASLSALQPDLQSFARALVDAAGAAGYQPRVTSTLRSNADQRRLYSRFLAGANPYPVARPGTSAHEYGWAFDMVLSPMSALSDAGALWESWGGVWGGRPTRAGSKYDPVHFEFPGWRGFINWNAPDTRQQADARDTALDQFFGIHRDASSFEILQASNEVLRKIPVGGPIVQAAEDLFAYLFPR